MLIIGFFVCAFIYALIYARLVHFRWAMPSLRLRKIQAYKYVVYKPTNIDYLLYFTLKVPTIMAIQQTMPKIYVAGHRGMVGSAIVRNLIEKGHDPARIIGRTHAELDLTDQAAVRNFFETEKPDQVYLAAAKVGGIHANNTYPAEFIYDNLMVQANVIDAAFRNGVKKLLFLGSSCIYPKLASQPMSENALLTGF